MTPLLSSVYKMNECLGDTKFTRKRNLSFSIAEACLDFSNLAFSQFRVAVSFTANRFRVKGGSVLCFKKCISTALILPVLSIVRACSKEQVRRVNANSVVASVTNKKSDWNVPVRENPSNPMRREGALFHPLSFSWPVIRNAVSRLLAARPSSPNPATSAVRFLVHSLPKRFNFELRHCHVELQHDAQPLSSNIF